MLKTFIKTVVMSLVMACGVSFAAGGYISNQHPLDSSTLNGSDRVNPDVVLYVDQVYPNINIKTVTGTKVWSFTNPTAYWAVLDRFPTGPRASGYKFLYAQGPLSRRVGYAQIDSLGCATSGGNYTGTVKFSTGEIITYTTTSEAACTGGD